MNIIYENSMYRVELCDGGRGYQVYNKREESYYGHRFETEKEAILYADTIERVMNR